MPVGYVTIGADGGERLMLRSEYKHIVLCSSFNVVHS